MALLVHLPLNGDLHNQGLAELTYTGTPVFKTTGKIGNSAFDLSHRVVFNCPSLDGIKTFSIAFWAKVNSDSSLSTNWVDVISFTDRKSDGSVTGFLRWETCYSGTWGISSHDNSAYNISSLSNFQAVGKDIWHHITITVDLENNEVKEYQNGILQKTSTCNGGSLTGAFHLGENNLINGEIQDVRVYDNALSQLEISNLAKALILHYPLSDPYIENTINLITTEDCLSPTCYNGATGKYNYGTSTDMYKTVTTFDGRKGTKVYMGTNGNYCCPYVYINDMYTSNGTNAPAYKTLSFDYYTTISTSITPYKLGTGTGIATYRVRTGNTVQTGTYTNSGKVPVVPNKWNHIEITFHGTTDDNAKWGYIQNNPTHLSDTNNFWFFANMQLEEKDHATGYAGVNGVRTENTVYDTSGFKNNGTINGNLTISIDSPRYLASTYFDGDTACIRTPYDAVAWQTNFTINLWFKKNKLNGNKGYETLFGGPAGFEMDTRSGNSTTLSLYMASTRGGNAYSPFNLGEWYMVTMVNDGTNELYYVNGELSKTIEKKSMPSGDYFIGAWKTATQQNYKGLISDFRIYASCLSPLDIKALYKTSGAIDSNGNSYAYEYIEN